TVQKFLLNSHAMILLSIIMASRTRFLTVPGHSFERCLSRLRTQAWNEEISNDQLAVNETTPFRT
ncbi:hypothetical protein, partial [Mesorhizobium sp. B2-4-13]|uniref:hypothetical protein n=1 Tax=Mesorhizobium sp. B2-4-13 TaxID=2589936 RepID=UPI001AEEB15B